MVIKWWLLRTIPFSRRTRRLLDNSQDLRASCFTFFLLLLYTREQLVVHLLEGNSLPWLPSFRKLAKRVPLGCPSRGRGVEGLSAFSSMLNAPSVITATKMHTTDDNYETMNCGQLWFCFVQTSSISGSPNLTRFSVLCTYRPGFPFFPLKKK